MSEPEQPNLTPQELAMAQMFGMTAEQWQGYASKHPDVDTLDPADRERDAAGRSVPRASR